MLVQTAIPSRTWAFLASAALTGTIGCAVHSDPIASNESAPGGEPLQTLQTSQRSDVEAVRAVQRVRFDVPGQYLIVEVLDDDLVHFELSAKGAGPGAGAPLFTSPMVAKTDYAGPTSFVREGNTLRTPELEVAVDAATLCTTVTDRLRGARLNTICPRNLAQDWKGLTLTPGETQNAYGLGQEFVDGSTADGDWVGRVRSPGGNDGNAMTPFANGANGNTQIPVLYALGAPSHQYALFLDQVYKQRWDFQGSPWVAEMWGDQIRWYVMTGADLPDLRRDYMELVGRPLVPPKKAFGLWVSEYGYENWAELESKLTSLRAKAFPVDGFVLDLFWFGGVTSNSDNSRMGSLTWDEARFPNPAAKIAALRTQQGVGIIPIEESYISRGLPEHADLQGRGYLARDCATCGPTYISSNPWWGKGGMLDWTNDAAADYWHETKRQPLIDTGIVGHWTDLGEPEMYNANAWYQGIPGIGHAHADVHNIYNFKWLESIARGYERHGARRPFMMSRSGAAGIQRFGSAMWSGDIGTSYPSLIAHLNAQMHMAMSGIDYFGADIGGFHRGGFSGNLNELFTQWFADGMLLDVPGRTHTENLCNCKETAPDRIGDVPSNLDNVRMRYELSPFLYSLAHLAYRFGDPVFPPLVYAFPNDANVREMGHEKLIGTSLLLGIVAGAGETQRDVYLPAGTWVDYYTNAWITSQGEWARNIPEYRSGRFKLPLFARAGAIVPKMFVDEKTMNILGMRTDGTRRDELVVRVYPSAQGSSFTLYEDDGETTAYRTGKVRTTLLSQKQEDRRLTVTIAAAAGTYTGALASRANVVELVLPNAEPTGVTLNGVALTRYATKSAFDAAASGWFKAGTNLVLAKSQSLSVTGAKTFVVTAGP
ncbi:TIM-barrel domain-containing protein [Pendulispora albinea]|uniref:DUF5110 domain-containing protein n=1 Tax=Pendulispora albinea TaxID=2741071 RepID=A0ABZ2MCR6_9BACT